MQQCITKVLCFPGRHVTQGATADAEAKSEELSGAVEELHKLLKEAGEGEERETLCSLIVTRTHCEILCV